jgi:hypothetical protein
MSFIWYENGEMEDFLMKIWDFEVFEGFWRFFFGEFFYYSFWGRFWVLFLEDVDGKMELGW